MNRDIEKQALFGALADACSRPKPFEVYTAEELWTNEHTSAQMLAFHLDESIDLSSRNHAFIDRSVKWIAERFGVGSGTRIADFGCGPGLYTTRLARLGARATGIDFSRRSIEYARSTAAAEGLEIAYINENYLELDLRDRFELITMIFCDFCALGPSQRQTLLHTFASLLEPGGAILLDVHSLATFEKTTESSACEKNQLGGFWSPDDYYGIVNVFKYLEEKISLHKYTIVEESRIRTVYNWLQYFDVVMLERELSGAGLAIAETYADVAGAPYRPDAPELAIVAVKP